MMMHPFVKISAKTENERVLFMYAQSNSKNYPAAAGQSRHSRKRTNSPLSFLPLLILPLVIFLFSANRSTETEITSLEKKSVSQRIELFFDWEEPQISGITNLYTYTGETLSYLDRVSTTDDTDPEPTLRVDDSLVNLNYPGIYPIYYIAEDASGNQTTAPATVTVMQMREGYANAATVFEAVDKKLDLILLSDMTVCEQVQAIYQWTRGYLMYADTDDHSDWFQSGYQMLTTGSGDCFGYFAAVKLMLERLGIPNIDVCKVKNSDTDSDHFWSLVSVDGGLSYYHLDTTPRMGQGDTFLLVSDTFLDSYSDAHGKSHNRDLSLYPATPEDCYGA